MHASSLIPFSTERSKKQKTKSIEKILCFHIPKKEVNLAPFGSQSNSFSSRIAMVPLPVQTPATGRNVFQLQGDRSYTNIYFLRQIASYNRMNSRLAGSELQLSVHKQHRCSLRFNSKFHKLCLLAAVHGTNFVALL